MAKLDPKNFIITRKRKKYKFAIFSQLDNCFELHEWQKDYKPTALEMGAGTGLFSAQLAGEIPGERFIAVDVKADRLQTGAKKAEQEGSRNIRFLRARADQLLEVLPEHSLNAVWVTFPDPFPKTRTEKHRLTHLNYLRLYAALLNEQGMLYFKTDARDLFMWSLEQLVKEGWVISELSFDLHESDLANIYKTMTTYETRYTGEGLPICFVTAHPPAVLNT